MDWETRAEIFDEYIEKELEIAATKGREYASSEDTLSNFKLIAHIINKAAPLSTTCPECGATVPYEISPFVVLIVYLFKHLLAILDYAGHGESRSNESLFSRVVDAVVYLKLFDCLRRDERA